MTDCAVDVFSKTLSSFTSHQRQQSALSTTRGRTTINDLPAELVCVIFRLTYAAVYKYHYWNRDCPEQDKWLEQDLMSTSLFPYAPASVCTFWRDVMSSVPKCWGRVVIFVDPPSTPLPIIASQLSWSRDGQLDVFITRRAFHNVDGQHERSQIAVIMDLIFPHIHRIRDLSINAMFSSSLPSIVTDFHGTAPMMLNLLLQCREDDGGSDRSESAALTDREKFRCPNLKRLTIDGRNWYEASRSDPQWTNDLDKVFTVNISHFRPNPGESFSPHELLLPLPAISNLETLRITDLVFDPSREPLNIEDLDLPWLEFLYFEDLQGFEVVGQIIRFLDPFNISFTRCIFDDITDASGHFTDPSSGGELRLTNISHDLAPLLRLWHGHSLNITNCPTFDDTLLNAMGSQDNGVFNCASFLRHLMISNCTNFSVPALRRFVESRLDRPVPDPMSGLSPVTPRICDIHLHNDVPSMSMAEKAWFDANLPGL